MITIFVFIAMTIFLFGLYQWAKGGATLFQIFRIRRQEQGLRKSERQKLEEQVQQLERATDSTLRTSFRLLGFLAVFLWVVLGATIILDMMGIDWVGRVTARAQQYWSQTQTNTSLTQNRSNVLRNMGNNLRK